VPIDLPRLPILIRPIGRILRAPDHDAGTAEGDGGAAEGAAEGGAEGAEDKTLMTGGAAEGGEGEGGSDEGGEAKEGDGKEAGAEEGKEGEEGKNASPEGPPEKYELTLPEGMALDEGLMAEATPVFQELKLDNEGASKLIPLIQKYDERRAAAQIEAHDAMGADWAKAAKADPRIGGKNWTETERFVAKALDTAAQGLGKEGAKQVGEFKQLLDDTKLGNHPVLISMFRFYGERISEDTDFVRPDAGAPVKQDRLVNLYPDDVPKE
jgi:hypothetical protein